MTEWVTIPAEHLRIVPAALWQAAHDRLTQKRSSAIAAPPLIVGRGVRQRYLLTGFGRCLKCGGAMQAVSRASSAGRNSVRLCHVLESRCDGVQQRDDG
jgi:hypothetical protein